MACISRPKPPSFWGQTTLLLLIVAHVAGDAQVDVPPDSLYFDPRYQFDPATRGKADQRSPPQRFDTYTGFSQGRPDYTPKAKPAKELDLDSALNAFLKTQDPKYFQFYRNGDSRDRESSSSVDRSSYSYPTDSQVAALLKQIDDVSSQQCTANVLAQWNFETDVNEVTQLEAVSTGYLFSMVWAVI